MAQVDLKAVITAEDKASGVIKKTGRNLDEMGKKGKNSAADLNKAAIAVGALGIALTVFAKKSVDSFVDYTKGIKVLSRETGATEQEISRLMFAGQRLGLSTEELSQTFGIFAKNIVESNKVSKDAVLKQKDLNQRIREAKLDIQELVKQKKEDGDKSGQLALKIRGLGIDIQKYRKAIDETISPLKKLGIETKDTQGKQLPFSKILNNVADRFKNMPDGIDKTAASLELFGRSGKDLIPLLNQGSDGLEQLAKKADELGITLTPENLDKVNRYIKAQKDLQDSTMALKMRIGEEAIPMFTLLSEKTNSAVESLLKMPEPMRSVTSGVIAFSGPVLTATGGLLAFAANLQNALPLLAHLRVAMIAVPWAAVALAATTAGSMIWQKWTETRKIINHTKDALLASGRAAEDAMARMDKAVKKGKATQEQAERLRKSIEAGQRSAEDTSRSWQYLLGPTLNKQIESLRRPPDPFRRRQHGGSVMGGSVTLVGEEGPEMFTPPSGGGQITPNHRLEGNTTINLHVNVGMYAGSPREKREMAREMLGALKDVAAQQNLGIARLM